MARKDDPVFNVRFVQLVESQACLWNYTHPGYSKKEEVQKAWQHVANEIKDTVRNCRERWRTIRSSFLRSLKLARTQTGRGKRKYYLSKYLQFLIPYTKSRACHKQGGGGGGNSPNGMVLRKPSTSTAAATFLAAATLSTQPMTRINHMRLLEHHNEGGGHDDETKDSNNGSDDTGAGDADAALPLDVQVSLHEDVAIAQAPPTTCIPLRLHAIKIEQQQQQQHCGGANDKLVPSSQQQQHSLVTLPVTMAAAMRSNMDWTEFADWLKSHNSHGSNANSGLLHMHNSNGGPGTPPPGACTPAPALPTPPPTVASLPAQPPDADYSFLISLHPYLKEMNGKQNRRFRQKVVGLIDTVLDNADV